MLDQQKITIIYCRLSVEDIKEDSKGGRTDESNSIQNQRELLLRYAKDHGYTNTKVLIDDGYTGTNFNRPGVQEGFELVKRGLVGCWLVKDMSRFGRDYLTVGQYTDIIFPSYDVRFIAVADGVDSAHGDNEGFTAIRNLFNEWYPRDTSKKVRAVFRQKGTSGKHLGQAPFGYTEDPNNPGYWLLDEEAAKVVRHIFALCIDGNGPSRIARMLEKEQVLTVKSYYAMKKGKPLPEYPYRWNDNSVVGILERIEYTGCTCNFKTYSKSFKLKKRLPNDPENMYWRTRRKPSSPRCNGTEYRSFAQTNAVPLKRNGRDCSPGYCSVPIAAISSILQPVRALRESRITMYAPATRATEEPVAHIISVKIPCVI